MKALILSGWTQGTNARWENGDGCYYNDPRAVCWCLNGAFLKVTQEMRLAHFGGALYTHLRKALDTEAFKTHPQAKGPYTALFEFNDSKGRLHSDIMSFLDRVKDTL